MLDVVDDSVKPRNDTVNLLAERYFFNRGEDMDKEVFKLFDPYGIKVNCRFTYLSSMDTIRNFRLGKMNYIIDDDVCSIKIASLVSEKLGVPVDKEPLPVGIREYRRFSEKIGKEFGIPEKAAEVLADEERRYYEEIDKIKQRLKGKRVLIENRFLQDIDWLIELIADLDMEIILIEMGPANPWKEKRPESKYLSSGIPLKYDYTVSDMMSDIKGYSPDIVLSDSVLRESDDVHYTSYSKPGPGVNGVLHYGRRLGDLIRVPKMEGWRNI
jgi:nitrogenase molybdenum-iron protein alpha/beta subunit